MVLRKRKSWSKNVYITDFMKKIYLNREARQRDIVSINSGQRMREHLCMSGHRMKQSEKERNVHYNN